MTVQEDLHPISNNSSPADNLVRGLSYLKREAEECGLAETAFLIAVAIASVPQDPEE